MMYDYFEGQRVLYVPPHANKDVNHISVEHGTVSTVDVDYVFVKFDEQLRKLGWDNTTAQACRRSDLVPLANYKVRLEARPHADSGL